MEGTRSRLEESVTGATSTQKSQLPLKSSWRCLYQPSCPGLKSFGRLKNKPVSISWCEKERPSGSRITRRRPIWVRGKAGDSKLLIPQLPLESYLSIIIHHQYHQHLSSSRHYHPPTNQTRRVHQQASGQYQRQNSRFMANHANRHESPSSSSS